MSDTNRNSMQKVKLSREYSTSERAGLAEKLIAARIALLLRQPFFGNLVTRLKMVEASDWCKTIATDGRNIYYNLDFVNGLNDKQAEFVMCHEVLHCVFDHFSRRGDRDTKISNFAADFAVNQILLDDNVGKAPGNLKLLHNEKYRDWSYEEIFDDLKQNSKTINMDQLGELLDDHLELGEGEGEDGKPTISISGLEQLRADIMEALLAAAQACNGSGQGKVPAGIARLIKHLTEPKMDWRQLLRQQIESVLKTDFTFARPNRKSQACGAILPGMTRDPAIKIAVAIDMSGSISDEQGRAFLSEVKGIVDTFTGYEIDIMTFDTKVYNHKLYTSDDGEDITQYEMKGGGGTDFNAVWEYMKEHEIQPKKLIMFTDGYCDVWGDPDYVETLWVIYGNPKCEAPHGITCHYED